MVRYLWSSLIIGMVSAILGSLFLNNTFGCERFIPSSNILEMCEQTQLTYTTIYFIFALLLPFIVSMVWHRSDPVDPKQKRIDKV